MKRFFCLVICSLFFFTGCKNDSYFEMTSEENSYEEVVSASATSVIFVQVAGEVVYPGVYELTDAARVFQAIEAAGGLTENADDSNINMAQQLNDGEKIYIFSKDELKEIKEAQDETAATSEDGRVNINSASAIDLCTLPGIGKSKANLIVSYREANGAFSTITDIKKVSGIGDGIYNQIKDLIKTD